MMGCDTKQEDLLIAWLIAGVHTCRHIEIYEVINSSSFKSQISNNEIASFWGNMIFNKQFMHIYVLLDPTRIFRET